MLRFIKIYVIVYIGLLLSICVITGISGVSLLSIRSMLVPLVIETLFITVIWCLLRRTTTNENKEYYIKESENLKKELDALKQGKEIQDEE